MKNLFLCFIMCITLSCKAQMIVGEVKNSELILIANDENLISYHSKKLLKESDIKADFTKVKLFEQEGIFYLRLFGGTFVSTSLLEQVGNKLLMGSITCTTNTCPEDGCVPSKSKTKCSPCYGGGCVKSITH